MQGGAGHGGAERGRAGPGRAERGRAGTWEGWGADWWIGGLGAWWGGTGRGGAEAAPETVLMPTFLSARRESARPSAAAYKEFQCLAVEGDRFYGEGKRSETERNGPGRAGRGRGGVGLVGARLSGAGRGRAGRGPAGFMGRGNGAKRSETGRAGRVRGRDGAGWGGGCT